MGSREISKRVEALRKLKRMSQQELADKAGVGVATIRNIEAGKPWSSTVMDKIDKALGGEVW